MAYKVLIFGLLAISCWAAPADDVPEITRLNPPGMPSPDNLTQVTVVKNAHKMLYIAGQTAVNTKLEVVGKTVTEQADEALKNLTFALAAGSARRVDVLQLNVFFVASDPEAGKIVSSKLKDYFKSGPLPSITYVGVPKLVGDGLLVEIEGVAVVQPKAAAK